MLTILGIAGLVMSLQPGPAATAAGIQVAAAEPEPAPAAEARLPEELSFSDTVANAEQVPATPASGASTVAMTPAVAAPTPAADPAPEVAVAMQRDDMIASTFDQLVEPVVVPAEQVPEGAVATVAAPNAATPATPVPAAPATPAPTAVAEAAVDLPMSNDGSVQLSAHPRPTASRNAAAWAIESEVPDAGANSDSALGYAPQPPDEPVRIAEGTVNVRSGPSQDNKRLFALKAGAEVDVEGKSEGWVSIKDAKGREGWVDASLLDNLDLKAVPVAKDVPAAEPDKPDNVKTVTGSGVSVRSGPGKSNKQVFTLASGSEVTVLDDNKGWLKIKDAKGRTGWAYQSYMK